MDSGHGFSFKMLSYNADWIFGHEYAVCLSGPYYLAEPDVVTYANCFTG